MAQIPSNYYTMLSRIESSNQIYARARTSTASGFYQFIRSTWESLGGRWGNQAGVAFGGLRPTAQEQLSMAEKLTQQNAGVLTRNNIPINNASLYAAHFLGAGAAATVLKADPNTPITAVTTQAQRTANPTILKGTVGDFAKWLERKTGVNFGQGQVTQSQTPAPNAAMNSNPLFGSGGFFDQMLPDLPTLPSLGNLPSLGGIIEGAKEAVSNPVERIIESIKEAFADPIKRTIYVVLGILLVAIAIIFILKVPEKVVAVAGARAGVA